MIRRAAAFAVPMPPIAGCWSGSPGFGRADGPKAD